MELDGHYLARVRAGELCCYNARIVNFDSGHLCQRCAPPELRAVAHSQGTHKAVEALKALIPQWATIAWQKPPGKDG